MNVLLTAILLTKVIALTGSPVLCRAGSQGSGNNGNEQKEDITAAANDPDRIMQAFDSAVSGLVGSGKATGATAVLVQNGKAVMQKGYGFCDKSLKAPVDTSLSGFRIGSVSKTFVALAAIIAEEDGKLELNTDVTNYLEADFPGFRYPVTMHQLLTHTAGFEDVITGIAVNTLEETESLSASVRRYRPVQVYQPGEITSYSNYGLALAAYVIEKATGTDFAEYCRERIFAPLGMNKTSIHYRYNSTLVSKAYLPNGKETFEPYINLYPEGAGISTAEDMGRYLIWLLGDQESILKKEGKAKLFARNFYMADELDGVGYIWNIRSRGGRKYYEKKGETLNFYSRIVLYPDCGTGIFFSLNTYVAEEEINAAIEMVTDALFGGEKQAAAERKAAAEGKAAIDIRGSYVNTVSSFKTAEKFLRYILPGKIITIAGTRSGGYRLNGVPITHIGNDTYDTPFGKVRFLVRDGKILLASDPSHTYIRMDGAAGIFESKTVIAAISVLFLVTTFMGALFCTILLLRKRKLPVSVIILSITQLSAAVFLLYRLITGLLSYSVLSHIASIHAAAWVILLVTAVNLILTLTGRAKSGGLFHVRYRYVHDVLSIAFCFVMLDLNLLM